MTFGSAKEVFTRRWNPGMSLPVGGQPQIKMGIEKLRQCPRDGKGTLEDPLVIWAAHLTDRQRRELRIPEFEQEEDLYRAIDANADVAKTAAIRSGCTVVWIICPVHTSKYAHDENGDRVPIKWDHAGNPAEYLVLDADPHITVKLGVSEDLCLLHGHINVRIDERGFPTQFMSSFQRYESGHITDGDDRVLELFEWRDKGDLTAHLIQQEAAYYKLFSTMTVSCSGEWELEDLEHDDPDYKPPEHLELLFQNNTQYVPDNSEEASMINGSLEEYLVRKWSPYEKGEGIVSMHNFGYNTITPFSSWVEDKIPALSIGMTGQSIKAAGSAPGLLKTSYLNTFNSSTIMPSFSDIETTLASVEASPRIREVLRDLHTKALSETPFVSTGGPLSDALDKFVALDPDKCALVYLLLRATGARFVVEAGTSFGLSTIYLALAVGQNASLQDGNGKVIATENESHKAARAREHWKAAGDEIEKRIELREGDLRETLKVNLPPHIDFLLLDIWTPLALPTLKLVQPNLKIGATIVTDNTIEAAKGYEELVAYLGDPSNGFKTTTAPYSGGLLIAVYVGKGTS
ncbi:S-adenosyl-L-methionine-dependent methyltransferase [Hypoxylon trugodes]|uniref:S-adenosyl-L-methionine-dependent methyltransferase n=1 Tax=Hypoxylon trugodes TaxID=326681 RepID=UPI0021A221BB|nr:S-adenosyl-L-methionine-dependent methyltransferase [Hypoxylon trugodes]KAI1386762.1 S-adenosyl-L-methionine-dependent methyltransferase [Hypoxylon trugodes]